MVSVLGQVISDDSLGEALASIVDDHESSGREFRPSLRRLVESPLESFEQIRSDAQSESWRPQPLIAVEIPKSNGQVRELGVPVVRERVLERALLRGIEPILDVHLGSASFGYRRGLGVGAAVRRVVALREEGFSWVVRTDVNDCFPSIRRSRVRRALELVGFEAELVSLVDKLVSRPFRVGSRLEWREGLPQGSALSPLLSNLVLAEFDAGLLARGIPIVRYVDDCVLFGRTEQEGRRAMEDGVEAARGVGVELGSDKSELTDFATGFSFLGEDFNARYPPSVGAEAIEPPDRRVLYVGVQGSYVSVGRGRLTVRRKKKELLSVPQRRVERLVCFGSITVSPGARSWALENSVEVLFCSRRGRLVGRLEGHSAGSAVRRRAQYLAVDDEALATRISSEMIDAKLHNQRVLVERYVSREVIGELRPKLAEINSYRLLIADSRSRNGLLGVEGIAARRYFEALACLIPETATFEGRSTRPPADIVNAALSYGYAILASEATTACAAAGLDPAVGVLHSTANRRAALALDLMEEFRPVVVDPVIVDACRRGMLRDEMGRVAPSGAGVWMNEKARRFVTGAVERRLLMPVFDMHLGKKATLRRVIHLQAQRLAGALSSGSGYVSYRRRV